jgi:hypothetical protein
MKQGSRKGAKEYKRRKDELCNETGFTQRRKRKYKDAKMNSANETGFTQRRKRIQKTQRSTLQMKQGSRKDAKEYKRREDELCKL